MFPSDDKKKAFWTVFTTGRHEMATIALIIVKSRGVLSCEATFAENNPFNFYFRFCNNAVGFFFKPCGQSPDEIARRLAYGVMCVYNVKSCYLHDRLRQGKPVRFDGIVRAKLTVLACLQPPAEHARRVLQTLGGQVGYRLRQSHKNLS